MMRRSLVLASETAIKFNAFKAIKDMIITIMIK
jgi:hypothetical protein